jgi:hypothetical protein
VTVAVAVALFVVVFALREGDTTAGDAEGILRLARKRCSASRSRPSTTTTRQPSTPGAWA